MDLLGSGRPLLPIAELMIGFLPQPVAAFQDPYLTQLFWWATTPDDLVSFPFPLKYRLPHLLGGELVHGYMVLPLTWLSLWTRSFASWLLLLRSGDVEVNPGPRGGTTRRFARVLYSNVRGLHGNIRDVKGSSSGFDIMLFAETKVSSRRHDAELKVNGFSAFHKRKGSTPGALGMAVYIRDGFRAYRQPQFECSCHEVCVVRICGRVNNFYVYSFYRNPHHDDSIYNCMLESMCCAQSSDSKSVFTFVGDANAHHKEWLGSASETNNHGHAAQAFCSMTGSQQLVSKPTREENYLDLVMTNVPDTVTVAVRAPIGGSDHSHLDVRIAVEQATPQFTVRKKIFLKHRTNWDRVRTAMAHLPWPRILSSPDPVQELNIGITQVISRFVPTKTLCFRSNDKPWFDTRCRSAFDAKQVAYRRWQCNRNSYNWQLFVDSRARAQLVYDDAQTEYDERTRETLLECDNESKWWTSLKKSIFGTAPSIPPLLGSGGAMIADPAGKADLLASQFNSKMSSAVFVEPPFCHPSPECSSLAFRSSTVKRLLLQLDSYGGVDGDGIFPLLLKESAEVISPKLSVLLRRLITQGVFPVPWRDANVTAIPKGAASPKKEEYRPISITPVLSKLFERLIGRKLSNYFEKNDYLPKAQFGFRKGLGCVDALLTISEQLQGTMDAVSGAEVRLVQLDMSSAFDRVNHAGLLFKLKSVGVGGKLLDLFQDFLTNRIQRVVVDCFVCR